MSMPVAFHQPGTTVLHRAPAGLKLAGLLVVSIVVVLLHGVVPTTSVAVASVLAGLVARLPWRRALRASRSILVVALVAGALQWWWYDAGKAAETLVDLLALSLLGLVLTTTTPVVALVDVLTAALGPLRRLGLDPDRVALAITLAIGALPTMVGLARESRDAAAARGLERSPRAMVTPFVVRVVARAHQTGDALAARGIDDVDPVER